MKKIFFLLTVVTLFAGCAPEESSIGITTVINMSLNFDIEYIIGFPPTITKSIAKDSEDSFENIHKYAYIGSFEPSKRVTLKVEYPYKNDILFSFNERESYVIKVINGTGQEVILSSDGWMDEIVVSADPNEQSNPNWLIYSDNPNFTATPANGFSAQAVYNFDENIFKVTIRWSS